MSIAWQEWGVEAFERSKKEGKPILLDIFGVWCHWCHRMDEDNYENPETIKIITEQFIPVRVDTDKRPDINDRYNQGGWPTTAFLDEKGWIITGATYVPPQEFGPLLEQVAYQYSLGRKGQPPGRPFPKKPGAVTEQILLQLEDHCTQAFDPYYGGFGEPKFPMPELLEFLLVRYRKTNNPALLTMVEKTVQSAISGIYDKEAGGFFRYSVTPDWQLPHYEKMLDTNAGMVHVLASLVEIGKKGYLPFLTKTVEFLTTTLGSPLGGFGASQDADKEEAYYGKTLAERSLLPTPYIDRTLYADLQGLGIRALLAYLRVQNDQKIHAYLDKTITRVTTALVQNGRVAHYPGAWLDLLRDHASIGVALAEAGQQFGRQEWTSLAGEIATTIEKTFSDPSGYFDVTGKGEGKLSIKQQLLPEHAKVGLLYAIMDNQKKAEAALAPFATDWEVHGVLAAEYGLAVQRVV